MEQYIPQPKNLDGVIVYGPFRELVNKVAAKVYQNWLAERIKEGNTLLVLSNLKLWNELTDAQKASSLDSAEQAVKLLMHDFPLLDMINGDISFDREKIVDAVAENAHEVWARQRMDAGWTYGETRDNEAKKHPMLKPYSELPDSEKAYDRAYGEIAFDEIEKMATARKEMIKFGELWGLDIDSREFNELYQFSWDFEQLPVQQRLDIVNDVIGDFGRSDELVELRENLLLEKKELRDISEDMSAFFRATMPSQLELGLDSMRALKHGISAGKAKGTFYTVFPEDLENGIVPPGCSIGVDKKGNKFLETFSQNCYVPKDGLFLVKEVNEGNLYNVCTKKQFDTLYNVGEDGIAKSVVLASKTMKPELKQLTPDEKTKARRAKSASIYKSLVAAERNRNQGIKIK